jgi:type I restriction enzyme S subunit
MKNQVTLSVFGIKTKGDIMYFRVHCDYETSRTAGAGEMFQIIDVKDDNDKDFTHLIDQGQHYHSLDEVRNDLAAQLNISASDIEIDED